MKVTVTKEKVSITESAPINENEVNVNLCEFILPDVFNGLSITAVFNNIPVPIIENKCVIPNLKKGTAILGVFAYSADENGIAIMYSPNPTYFSVGEGSFSQETKTPTVPEISEFENYCRQLTGLLEVYNKDLNKKINNLQERIRKNEPKETVVLDGIVDFICSVEGEYNYSEYDIEPSAIEQGSYYVITDNEKSSAFAIHHKLYDMKECVINSQNNSLLCSQIDGKNRLINWNLLGEHYLKLCKIKAKCEIVIPKAAYADDYQTSICSYDTFEFGNVQVTAVIDGEEQPTQTITLEDDGDHVKYTGDSFTELASEIEQGRNLHFYVSQVKSDGTKVKLLVGGKPEIVGSLTESVEVYCWNNSVEVDE